MYTMNCCTLLFRPLRILGLLAALAGGALSGALPVQAQQVPAALGNVRTFPPAALRGTLVVDGMHDAHLDGKAIRMAPGMRLFSPQNALVQAHTVIHQKFTVNYLIEASTGMLLTAWILSNDEAAQKRAGQEKARSFFFQSDAATPR